MDGWPVAILEYQSMPGHMFSRFRLILLGFKLRAASDTSLLFQTIWNRDVNAARNIRRIFMANHGARPEIFRRGEGWGRGGGDALAFLCPFFCAFSFFSVFCAFSFFFLFALPNDSHVAPSGVSRNA